MPFLVECKPDRVMIDALTATPKRNIIHAGNKSGVIKRLIKNYENSKGIVDEDPGSPEPKYLQRFKEIEELKDYSIRVLHYASRNNYLIILRPRLEDWILRAAGQSNIDVKKYGLPDDPVILHAEINLHIDKFERLIKDLVRKSRHLRALAKILMG